MDYRKLQILIEKIKTLSDNKREKTLFDIGTRGHFENPTTDVLAFFCNTTAEHGMGTLVMDSLIAVLERKKTDCIPLTSHAFGFPQREVVTDSNKRIDLLLSSDSWVMAIENKIYHQQINPFSDYEAHVDTLLGQEIHKGKQPIFVLLSPEGTVDDPSSHKKWCGISYLDLINEIKINLQVHFFNHPFDKWILILKDFLLHLENIVTYQKQDKQHEEFVLENIVHITKAWKILNDSFGDINQRFIEKLKDEMNIAKELQLKKTSWFDSLPTYKYIPLNNTFELVLFAAADSSSFSEYNPSLNSNKNIFLQIHIPINMSEQLKSSFDNKEFDQWKDKKTIYFRKPVSGLSIEQIVDDLYSAFITLNQYE